MTAPRWLDWLDAFHLIELPRPAESPTDTPIGLTDPDPGRRQRVAALAAAYHADPDAAVVATAWCRPSAGGPLEILAGGAVAGGAAPGGDVVLGLPAGARARPLPPGGLAAALKQMPVWTPIAAAADALLAEPDAPPPLPAPAPGLADALLGTWWDAFAWLVVAVAVTTDEVDRLATETGARAREAGARAAGSPEYALRSARLERQHRELRRAESTGLWRVHLLAGGLDAPAARRVAGLLAAGVDLAGQAYTLVPSDVAAPLDDVLYGQPWRRGEARSPFLAGSALLAALMPVPRTEVPGVRLRLRPEFDVTPEGGTAVPVGGTPVLDGMAAIPALRLGAVLDANTMPVGPFAVPTESLVRHVFVCGATGAGKSQTVRALLEEASLLGLPWLVVEPSKAEYRAMAARLPQARVIAVRPGDVAAVPAGLNPLEPAPGFPLQTHVDLVRALFIAAFEADEPFPQVLSAALTRCYEEQGWHLALGRPQPDAHRPRYPTLADLARCAEAVVGEIGYGREVTDNVRGFIRVRIGSLRLGTTGRFFEGGHPIDVAELLRQRVVFEIEDVGDDRDKAFLMGTVLIRLAEQLRVDARSAPRPSGPVPLRHLAVFEEAHRLLRKPEERGPASHAIELFAALLAEIRAYGEGIVVADQIPSKLVPDVIKNTAVKILHRLPAQDDRDVVGATVNLTPAQSAYLVTLPPGTAAAFADGMDYPVLVAMPDGTRREAGPAATVSAAGLVGRRSGTCGVDCRRQPCTLTDIENARHLLRRPDRRWLALWAEVCVIAHLTGWAIPSPAAHLVVKLGDLAPRLRDCAIGHAADAAVAARSAVIVRTAAPAGLAAHVTDVMRDRLAGRDSCSKDESQWLAYPYRWALVWDELMLLVRDSPSAPRHPRSAQWKVRYGRAIPGRDAAAQLDTVRRWYAADERDTRARYEALFGADSPSIVEQAVGTLITAEDWPDRLADALSQLAGDMTWAQRLLAHPPRPPGT